MRMIDADELKPYILDKHYKYRLVYDAEEVANAPTITDRPTDEEDQLKFYYVESIDDYWVGRRLDNFYYANWHEGLGFVWSHSRYLPWGEHVVAEKTLWKEHTYPSEPVEISFTDWIVGFVKKYFADRPKNMIHIDDVYRLIAGHSDYHGDSILSAFTCLVEGKDVKPIAPLDESADRHTRLTNAEWKDFLSEQFGISKSSAREMLHGMMSVKREDNFKKRFNQRRGERREP